MSCEGVGGCGGVWCGSGCVVRVWVSCECVGGCGGVWCGSG